MENTPAGGIPGLAKTIAETYNCRSPYTVCKEMGIVVHRHTLQDCRGYYMGANGISFITITDDLEDDVAAFVCAHELGHHLLHQRMNRVFMDWRTCMLPGRFENEADKFAVHFLFGGEPLFGENTIQNWQMAEMLNVPISKVNNRLIELGIYY